MGFGLLLMMERIFCDALEEFKAFALRSGAIVRESQGEYVLVEFDTTLTILRRRNTDHHLDEVLAQLACRREKLMNTYDYAWIDALGEVVSSELLQEVIEAEEQAIKTMGYYVKSGSFAPRSSSITQWLSLPLHVAIDHIPGQRLCYRLPCRS